MNNTLRYIFIFIVLWTLGLGKVLGQYTLGIGGDATTMKEAFDFINAGDITGDIVFEIVGDVIDGNQTAILYASGYDGDNNGTPSNYTSIVFYPATSGHTVSGNIDGSYIVLDGANNVTFDGRVGRTGSTIDLIIENTNTGNNNLTSSIKFTNSAENNYVKYCTVKGSEVLEGTGIIFFSTSTSGNGNDNNIISNNKFTNAGNGKPINAIYSEGSIGSVNSNITISDNLFVDCQNGAVNANGIYLNSYTTACSITGNSFFETVDITPAAGIAYIGIRIGNSTAGGYGNNFNIADNFIGGKEASCGGTAWTKLNGQDNTFTGIFLHTASGTASNLNNNTIQNLNWSNTGNNPWIGIHIAEGDVNIGNTASNTIGNGTGNGAILVTATVNGANVYGIKIESTGTVSCQNNIIGSITATNASTNATNLYGIYKSNTAGNTTISNNTLGSTNTANSLYASSNSTGNAQVVSGIYSAGTSTIIINNNTISKLTNSNTRTTGLNRGIINGISSTSGTNTISNNAINDLTIASNNSTSAEVASVCGISLSGATTKTVTDNTIYNLSNSYASFAGSVIGIYFIGSSSSNEVSRNFIHSLTVSSSTASVYGIKIANGATTYSNNIVSLGGSTNTILYGIYETGTAGNDNNLYFNSVYIGGSLGSGTAKSYGLYSAATTNTRNIQNNVFMNARSTTGGTNLHYATYFNYTSNTNLTLNYNDYFVSGTGGVLGYYNTTNKTTLPLVAGNDGYSYILNPNFVNAGTTTATDYKINTDLLGLSGTGSITIDYGAATRNSYTSMGAWEHEFNKWIGTTSTDWNTPSNWTASFVPAVDANIIFHDSPVNHCIQDQNRSVTDIINASSYYTVINGKKLTVKGKLRFGINAKVNASATSSNLEFVGTQLQEIPSGSLLNNEVYDLTVNNSLNVNLNGTLRLLNTITATSGLLDAVTTSPTVSYAGASAQLIESYRYTSNSIYDLIIDNTLGVSLNTNFTVTHNLTINSGKLLTIPTTKLLTVQGATTNSAGTSGLVLKSASDAANGSLIFTQPSLNPSVPATVEMYSKASWNLSDTNIRNRYKWQFIGIPVSGLTASPTFNGGYVRNLVETAIDTVSHWSSLTAAQNVEPFIGYEICQSAAKTYSFTGNLVTSDYNSGELAYTTNALYPGQHLLANPYAAAIDINSLLNSANLGSNMEQSIYLYNSGTFANWQANNGETTNDGTTTTSGQYTVSTAATAGVGGVPAQIPSMQAFLVKAMSSASGNTVTIPYSSATINSEVQRARGTSEKLSTDKAWTRIDLKGQHYSDQLWIFTDSTCSRKFNNGWDGHKLFGSSIAPQLFAMEADGNYQINAVADMNNTDLGFQAGEEKEFTLKFTHENTDSHYTNIYLFDLVAKTTTDITVNGTEYKFTAEPNTKVAKRFKIITGKLNQTADEDSQIKIYNVDGMIFIQNNSGESGEMKFYDISGKFIQQSNFSANNTTALFNKLLSGVYLAKTIKNGKEITKSLIVY